MMNRASLWMLLIACGAAYEIYDDNYPIGMDGDIYNEDSYNSLDLGQNGLELREDPIKNLMKYKLLSSLQDKDDIQLRMHYRPKFSMVHHPLVSFAHVPTTELFNLKDAVLKRASNDFSSAPTTGYKVKPVVPKQHKGKGQKESKLGTMVCYFKVCSIRLPA